MKAKLFLAPLELYVCRCLLIWHVAFCQLEFYGIAPIVALIPNPRFIRDRLFIPQVLIFFSVRENSSRPPPSPSLFSSSLSSCLTIPTPHIFHKFNLKFWFGYLICLGKSQNTLELWMLMYSNVFVGLLVWLNAKIYVIFLKFF